MEQYHCSAVPESANHTTYASYGRTKALTKQQCNYDNARDRINTSRNKDYFDNNNSNIYISSIKSKGTSIAR